MTDSQVLIRARMLRENGKYLPKQSYLMRKHYFNNEDSGVLKQGTKRQSAPPNPMTDPSMMTEMFKANLTSMVPMVRHWTNSTSGQNLILSPGCCWRLDQLALLWVRHHQGSISSHSEVQAHVAAR